MKKSLSALLWTLVFIALLFGMDQFFLRIPASVSPHREAQTFYVDFRTRLLALTLGQKAPDKQQAAPGQEQPPEPTKPPAKAAKSVAKVAPAAAAPPAGGEVAPRFIYVDKAGDLHFADSLQEVPDRYRAEARPLGR